MNDYYALLNVDRAASEDEIRKAIHREQRLWTNRTNSTDRTLQQEADRRIDLLDKAEDVLLDQAKRSNYDRELASQPKSESTRSVPEVGEAGNSVETARRLLEQGRIGDALYVAQAAADADPRDAEIWSILGRANHQFGETDRAIQCLKRAITLRPDLAQYQFDLGNIFESVRDWSSAAQCYERAIKVDRDVLMYRAAYGTALVNMGQSAAGIEVLEQCVQQEPDNASYQWFLAIGYADSAQVGWTKVGEGHPVLEPGEYATTSEQIVVAQQALNKALALKFDDADLTAQLTEVKRDIDGMTKRRFVGNKLVPAAFALVGLLSGGQGYLMVAVALLYAISTYIPQYIVNRQLVLGKEFNEFVFLGRIASMAEADGGAAARLIGVAVMAVVAFTALPFIAAFNLYRYQGDTIRGWLTSADNKRKLTDMMSRLQTATAGAVNATAGALANLKLPGTGDHNGAPTTVVSRPTDTDEATERPTVTARTLDSASTSASGATGPVVAPSANAAARMAEDERAYEDDNSAATTRSAETRKPTTSPSPVASTLGEAKQQGGEPRVTREQSPAVPTERASSERASTHDAVSGALNAVGDAVLQHGPPLVMSLVRKKLMAIGFGIAAIAIAVILVALFIWNMGRDATPDDASTATPAIASKTEIQSDLAIARKCLAAQDTVCAKASVDRVIAVEPGNTDAREMLAQIAALTNKTDANTALKEAERCLAADDLACARRRAEDALRNPMDQSKARALLSAIDARIRANEVRPILEEAYQCLTAKAAACALDAADRVLRIDPENAAAVEVKREALAISVAASPPQSSSEDGSLGQVQQPSEVVATAGASPVTRQAAGSVATPSNVEAGRLTSLINANLAEGRACLQKKKFECTIARAENVLQMEPENREALTLRQSAQDGQKKAFEESELQ